MPELFPLPFSISDKSYICPMSLVLHDISLNTSTSKDRSTTRALTPGQSFSTFPCIITPPQEPSATVFPNHHPAQNSDTPDMLFKYRMHTCDLRFFHTPSLNQFLPPGGNSLALERMPALGWGTSTLSPLAFKTAHEAATIMPTVQFVN